jgi:hypothetical protein
MFASKDGAPLQVCNYLAINFKKERWLTCQHQPTMVKIQASTFLAFRAAYISHLNMLIKTAG